MTPERSRLFCDTALAARIERVEAALLARASEAAHRRTDTGGFVIPIAGGVATYAEDGSPFNKVAGLGFGGMPSASELGGIERACATRGAPVQVELAHLADPGDRRRLDRARLSARGVRESEKSLTFRRVGPWACGPLEATYSYLCRTRVATA